MAGRLVLFVFLFCSSYVWGQESSNSYPGQAEIESSLQSLSNIESFTQTLEQKQNDIEARVTDIESKSIEISTSLKNLQETFVQALQNKDMQLKESGEKLAKSERTSSFFKVFSGVSAGGALVSTLLLILVVVL